MRSKLKTIICICIVIIIVCVFCAIRQDESPSTMLIPDDDSTTWAGPREIRQAQEEKTISIPGIAEMIFTADDTKQQVNIYNPETNECYIVFILYCDGVKIWKSGYCKPSCGYYEIELEHPLDVGTHKGSLVYECYGFDGERLNSARLNFSLIVRR